MFPSLRVLKTSKEIYDKLGELLYRNTIEKILSLRYDLHRFKVSNDEGILSCLSKACQIKGQLKDLGEIVSDNKIISAILNE